MAATSKVDIGNLALDNIGAKSKIQDFSESSVEAKEINRWYDICRKSCLGKADWSFARTSVALAQHIIAAPTNRYAYRYQLPADTIAARRIENITGDYSSNPTPYELEQASDNTKSLITDMEDAVLIYTFDQQTTSMFSPNFVVALSHLLAAYIAIPLTRKKQIRDDQYQLYTGLFADSNAVDANQMVFQEPREADWIEGR